MNIDYNNLQTMFQQGIPQQGIPQQPFIINNLGQYIPNMMIPLNQQQNQHNPFVFINHPQHLMNVPIVQQQQQQQLQQLQQLQQFQQFQQFQQLQQLQQPQVMNLGQNPFIMLQQQYQQPIINTQHQIPNSVNNGNGNDNYNGNENNDNIIANIMGNVVLNKKDKPQKPKKDNSFKQSKDNSNIINTIIPSNDNEAHFNAIDFPNEKYKATLLNGNEIEYDAKDLNNYTLETGKIMYTHNKSIPQDTMKGYASIYVRCSNPNGISINTQMTACLKYAKERDFVLQGVFIDNGVSGRHGKNLKDGEIGFWKDYIVNHSNLLIYSVDRLTRHLFSGLQLLNTMQEKNIDVHFVHNKVIYNKNISAMTKSSIQQELQTAEKYSNDTSEKIKGTINRLINEGKYIPGRIPYGYKRIKVNNQLKQVENSIEMDIITIIRTKYNTIWNNYNDYRNLVNYECRSLYYIVKYLKKWCDTQHFKDREQKYFTESKIKTFIMSKTQH